jgi:hypothetical protein
MRNVKLVVEACGVRGRRALEVSSVSALDRAVHKSTAEATPRHPGEHNVHDTEIKRLLVLL